MAITIPDAVLGATFTNDITGVTYTYDGQKWIADSGAADEHEHDEKYVNVSGDTMTGDLSIEPTTGSQPLVVKANPQASSNANVIDVFSNEGNRIFWVDSNRAGTTVHAGRPTNNYDLTDKRYVDEAVANAGSLFRAVYVSSTTDLKDGDIWFTANSAWVSWKTLGGRIWPVNPTVENWKFWPEGTEIAGGAHGRFIPESYMVWESVEDGHPMGMVSVDKIGWKGYVDENGEIIGREGYDTMAIKLEYTESGRTAYPTLPPAGTILRVRLAPWF